MWKRNIPNVLSIIRLLMIPIFVFVYMSEAEHKGYLSLGVYALAWFTDVLDGYLARKNNWITELGKILDPVADKLMQFAAVICLVVTDRLSSPVILVVFFKELLMLIGATLVARKKKAVAPSNWFGKLATFVLFVAVSALIVMPSPSSSVMMIMNILIIASEVFALSMYAIKFIYIFREKGQ